MAVSIVGGCVEEEWRWLRWVCVQCVGDGGIGWWDGGCGGCGGCVSGHGGGGCVRMCEGAWGWSV